MIQYESIEKLHKDCLQCQICNLRAGAKQVVPGEGNPAANIMFIGESPGATEDKTGKPFVGAAGKVLDILLSSIDIDRKDIFIANIIKCHPPKNRDPLKEEKEKCQPWLEEQIRLINPKIFVPLGRHALNTFLPGISITNAHGKIFKFKDKIIFVMYHPAAALYNGTLRSILVKDMQNLQKYFDGKLEVEEYLPEYIGKVSSSEKKTKIKEKGILARKLAEKKEHEISLF